jgi:hypothetical protein
LILRTLSLRVKCPESEIGYLHLVTVEVKNVGAIPPFSHTSSWRGAKLIKYRGNFTLVCLAYLYQKEERVG